MALDYGFTEDQKTIVQLARDIAQKKIKPVREHYDEREEFPWDVIAEIRRADLFGVYLPQEYGGFGGGTLELCLVMEELSRVCGGIAVGVTTSAICALPILLYGNQTQKKKWLQELASGKRLGAFAITEPESGSDATSIRSTAVLQGDHYLLNGTKHFCSSGNVAEIYTVIASTNPSRGVRGISALTVEKGTPGFTFGKKEKKMGIRANPTYELVFNNCRIPKENLIGKEGYGLMVAQSTFDCARPGVAAQAVGIAQGALDETLSYIRMRKQFGQPISSFQGIQHMVADCVSQLEAGRALVYSTCRTIDRHLKPAVERSLQSGKTVQEEMQEANTPRWTKEAAMAKLFCSDMAMKVTTDCVQMCGGIGYMRDFPVEKFMRDAKITQIYEGANQVQKNEIAVFAIREQAQKGRS